MTRKLCPECKGNIFEKDYIKEEITCKQCGLVVTAPPVCGFVFPGFLLQRTKRKLDLRVQILNVEMYVEIKYQF